MGYTLQIHQRKKGDVVILDLAGDLTLGEPEQMLRDAVGQLVSRKQIRIIVNMESVEYIDSSGVGALVKSYATLTRLGGCLKLLNPGKTICHTLKITGLLGVFGVCENETEALASF